MKHKREYRLLGICKFCNAEIYGDHSNKYQSHQRWCLKNPNRDKAVNQAKAAFKKAEVVQLMKIKRLKQLNLTKSISTFFNANDVVKTMKFGFQTKILKKAIILSIAHMLVQM